MTRLAAQKHRKEGLKLFYTAHGFHFYKGANKRNWMIYYPIEKFLAKYTDKLITITKEDFDLARLKFNTEIAHVHGVGVSSERYYPYSEQEKSKIRRELGFSEKEIILLCTGELNKNKNQKTVIEAVAKITKDIPALKLLVAGNGPLEKTLMEQTEHLKISESVDFLGYRTDLEKFVNISDIIISASHREGLPLNIMEGMLCKKPIIASDNRGHRELLVDGISGSLIHYNDAESYKNAIIHYINNAEDVKKYSSNAYDSVKTYSKTNVVKELKKIYEV